MLILKDQTAKLISDAVPALFGGASLEPSELAAMLEYPPDPAMGDLALPCFKLSRTLRRAPVQIAEALAGALSSDAFQKSPPSTAT